MVSTGLLPQIVTKKVNNLKKKKKKICPGGGRKDKRPDYACLLQIRQVGTQLVHGKLITAT